VSETVEVPFVAIGNRRCLTAQQLMEFPWLADFVQRFPTSFEHGGKADVYVFIEPHAKPVEET
jgi:hypothetical protein